MEEMSLSTWNRISEAIVVWSGFRIFPCSRCEENRVVEHFGANMAAEVLPLMYKIVDEFYATDAYEVASSQIKMGDIAEVQFRKKYPEISDEAVKALVWCYSFDNR